MSGAAIQNDGYPSLINSAVRNLESVMAMRKEIYGAVEPLTGIESEAVGLIRMLTLVKDVESFQTAGIGHQVFDIMDLGARLTASMNVIAAENRRRPVPKVLEPGHHEYTHLETMHGQFKEARSVLLNLVCTVHVGLTGNPRDGFYVQKGALMSLNEKVKDATGINLVLYDRLKEMIQDQTDELIRLSDDESVSVGLPRVSGAMVEEWLRNVEQTTDIDEKDI